MGHRYVKPSDPESKTIPERTPDCKILVHGTDWGPSYNVMRMLTSGKVPLADGWSPDKTSRDKYVKIFPWAWNQGGRCDNRAIFRHDEGHADAIIFVIDYTATDLEYPKAILQMMLREEGLQDSVLILLHNTDRPQTIIPTTTLDEVKQGIDFDSIPKSNRPTILPCYARTGEGMEEVVSYLTQTLLSDKRYGMKKVPEVKPEVDTASIIKQVKANLKDTKPTVPESA